VVTHGQILLQKLDPMTSTVPEPGVATLAGGHRAHHAQVADDGQVRPDKVATGGHPDAMPVQWRNESVLVTGPELVPRTAARAPDEVS
jgi:hypothetical protein